MTDFQPTEAVPGSDAKIAIMADRFRKGHPLFHPLDAQEAFPEREPEPFDDSDDEFGN